MTALVVGPTPAPEWVRLTDAARFRLRPPDSVMLDAGRRAAGAAAAAGAHPSDIGHAFLAGCVFWGLLEWEGVDERTPGADGGPDVVAPATPSLDIVDRLLRQFPAVADQLDRDYLAPLLARDVEKKGSSPSPTGISERAARTTAPRRARGAAETSAKSAATTKTRRKR